MTKWSLYLHHHTVGVDNETAVDDEEAPSTSTTSNDILIEQYTVTRCMTDPRLGHFSQELLPIDEAIGQREIICQFFNSVGVNDPTLA